jgi:hypothetical protein
MTTSIGAEYTTGQPFFIDTSKHVKVEEMSGVGKSILLVNLFIEHIRQGHGGLFIDPHGDTADQIAQLRRVYKDVEPDLIDARFMNWPADPWLRASYAFPKPGEITKCGPFLQEGMVTFILPAKTPAMPHWLHGRRAELGSQGCAENLPGGMAWIIDKQQRMKEIILQYCEIL